MRGVFLFILGSFMVSTILIGQQHIGGQLKEAALENRTEDPPSGNIPGRMYWDSDDNVMKVYTGVGYVEVGKPNAAEGPGSSTDEAIARFDGATGKLLQDTSPVTISDAGELKLPDGSLANPTLAFPSRSGTGFSIVGSSLVYGSEGFARLTIEDTKVIVGSNSKLKLASFGSDPTCAAGDVGTIFYNSNDARLCYCGVGSDPQRADGGGNCYGGL